MRDFKSKNLTASWPRKVLYPPQSPCLCKRWLGVTTGMLGQLRPFSGSYNLKKAFPIFFFSKSEPKMDEKLLSRIIWQWPFIPFWDFSWKEWSSKIFQSRPSAQLLRFKIFQGSAWPLADYDYKVCSSLLLFGSSVYIDHYQTSQIMGLLQRFSVFPKSFSSSVASTEAKSAQAKYSKKSSKDSSKEVEVTSYFPTYPVLSMHFRRM